jgi:Asp-tRNA(Asn)/Glu-tRNA(Gln) amidotransferase A subunit family amidase
VPLIVKDLVDTAGVRTTYASAIYRDHVPLRSAPAVRALEAAGAIVVGKANADEFAWGVCGTNAHYGDVVNPRRPDRIAGGSSAGSAAVVAAELVPLALGTDTAGSVRMPAAACGVVGLRPALGTISTAGVFPLAPSFDTVGPMAHTVGDCALAHAVLTGRTAGAATDLRGVRFGVLTAHPALAPGAPPAPRDERALALAPLLADLGAEVSEVTLPVPAADTWAAFYAEALGAHAATFPARAGEYGPGVRAKLEHAEAIDPAEGPRAVRALGAWRARARREPGVDVVLSPTLGLEELPAAHVDELEVRVPFSAYTRAISHLGWAAIAIGDVHLAARSATLLLRVAEVVESAITDSR